MTEPEPAAGGDQTPPAGRPTILILAIETTCDETGVAILEGPRPPLLGVPRVRSSVVASQVALHERFGGVVPEVAAREHLRQFLPVLDEALRQAGVSLPEIGAVAVATRPGLVGALIVGLTAAKSLAVALDVPLVAVDHLEGHLYACQMAHPEAEVYPCVGLVVSGGHTSLYSCSGPLDHKLLGGTIDDAAGEAFDKVSTLLGLGYPGGPGIERAALEGNPKAFRFPRSLIHEDRLAFSFSGLKTAVLYALKGQDARSEGKDLSPALVADVAASFQAAVLDVLVSKTRQALKHTGHHRIGIGGGVAANSAFRARMQRLADEEQAELFIPPLSLCTDNAAMAGIALPKLAAGQVASLDVDVTSGLVR
ncbi:tRNA (adenosine(37)-N6)-threonylcarbamoyltransferase complex transferase subunit TsaD [Isosphaeraceae bacterium EP7]